MKNEIKNMMKNEIKVVCKEKSMQSVLFQIIIFEKILIY